MISAYDTKILACTEDKDIVSGFKMAVKYVVTGIETICCWNYRFNHYQMMACCHHMIGTELKGVFNLLYCCITDKTYCCDK